jgi:hypothetical protein
MIPKSCGQHGRSQIEPDLSQSGDRDVREGQRGLPQPWRRRYKHNFCGATLQFQYAVQKQLQLFYLEISPITTTPSSPQVQGDIVLFKEILNFWSPQKFNRGFICRCQQGNSHGIHWNCRKVLNSLD